MSEQHQEQHGIKESMELLEGLKIFGVDAKKILADGKVNVADIPHGLDLLKNMNVLVDGIQGSKEIKVELKDLSQEERDLLLGKLMEVISALKAA